MTVFEIAVVLLLLLIFLAIDGIADRLSDVAHEIRETRYTLMEIKEHIKKIRENLEGAGRREQMRKC